MSTSPVPPRTETAAAAALYGFDAFSPQEISERIERIGVTKARLPMHRMAMLGALAGGFIGFGALYFMIVASDPSMGFAARRVLGGVVFSLGLLLVVVAGAELFTGNNLLVMAWADGRIGTAELLRNWGVVLLANAAGAIGLALLVVLSGHLAMNDSAVGAAYLRVAEAKASMPFARAFVSGILCNALVCLAVWMATAGRSVIDKAIAIVFPVSAFVAAGFEHSVANLFIIPAAIVYKWMAGVTAGADHVTIAGLVANLVPVVLGNIVGGGVFVALIYHVIYRRGRSE
ncbi:MAG: formate/nitrite transporter family protein [Gemmatimonadetes bacterium]|nr:formate/nitrite transporter family protein [Gemmatimonadota bacterium]